MEFPPESPVRGRREARRLDRRETIIAVAAASFLERGYAATTMSGIASTIGGSKATLWSYFPSKEALFEAVLEKATADFRAQLTPLLDTDSDPEGSIRSFCRRFIERVTAPEALALQRLAHGEAGRFPEMGTIFYERGPRTTQTLLARFISLLMDRGLLRRDDALRAARTLTSLCMSGCHQQVLLGLLDADPETVAADAEAAADLFLRAYAVR